MRKTKDNIESADEISIRKADLAHLARLAVGGRQRDIRLFLRRLINQYRIAVPELANQLSDLLRNTPDSPLRGSVVESIPVDLDSRLQLARVEFPAIPEAEPVWSGEVRKRVELLVMERRRAAELAQVALLPTKSALFVGPPGVGKTLAARWIANQLDRPLITLDLAAVMSSFLGRTGNNVKNVLDYAKGVSCVFLLDEFDAVAKRRDDAVEVGELKRLVTVLLQEIDDWPASGLLIAATNHPELLDPAVWRRFELLVEFPMPSLMEAVEAVGHNLSHMGGSRDWARVLATVLADMSFADIDRELTRVRRQSVMNRVPLEDALKELVRGRVGALPRHRKSGLAARLVGLGLSQREAHEWTGVSRDTIRKVIRGE